MVKQLAASARLPLSDPRRSSLDVSWSFSLRRTPGSDELATRMTLAALTTVGGAQAACERIAEATGLACRYVLDYGFARRYRVTVGLDESRCAVSVTDYGYDQPAAPPGGTPEVPTPSYETTRLCQELSECATDGMKLDGIQVHHALDGAVLVRFRAGLPIAPVSPVSPIVSEPPSADDAGPPPVAPDTSRSPGARG
ncbi:hypothetical protein NGB36_25190 [Streptomyces sp. RB6PN25]|uniref:Histidine kinase/HSP90-like ATPase domain-containing protein n=1 Tax=Streptomyces humicola TaxID=2953240 RepID=A0ABT1Q4V9_9ACTN|nr:hypothetical protein [Streptomyces humicola]MCQ4083797.1 hypothetical protein [Streptomyces humicola]